MNAVFLGTVGHLATSISADFTGGMAHAFVVSAAICLVAIFFSLVREGRHPVASASHSEEGASMRAAGGQ